MNKARWQLVIGVYLLVVASGPPIVWASFAWSSGIPDANAFAVLSLQDLFFQLWSGLCVACFALSLGYFAGLAKGARGSSILFLGVILVAVVSAIAKIFIVTIPLGAIAFLAFRYRTVPN